MNQGSLGDVLTMLIVFKDIQLAWPGWTSNPFDPQWFNLRFISELHTMQSKDTRLDELS